MEIDTTKLGERGQIVIPIEMRKGLHKGEKLIIIKDNGKLILESLKDIENIKEDIIDMKIAGKYWDKVKKGKVIRQTKKEFLKDLNKW